MTFKKHHYLEKNICTTLKAVKEDTSAPDPSNVVINEKAFIPTANKDTSVQTVLRALTTSTNCTSAPIKTSKKYQDKIDKTEALKKEKRKEQDDNK
ncbi:hypothetical protein G6F68_019813 [Rhizopus microsporus]|nr:hypothetical protein G6F68_019813 [Rhizopus microsporus]